jgi:hypothetical protein
VRFFMSAIQKVVPLPSKEQKLIIRALSDNLIADGARSVKAGVEMRDPLRRPDQLIKAMVAAKVLPRKVQYSSEPFVINNIKRVAICGIEVAELYTRRERIEDWVEFESHFMHSGEEVFRLLCNMLIHGYKAGLGTVEDDPLSAALIEYQRDPVVGTMLLSGGAPASVKLLDAFGVVH